MEIPRPLQRQPNTLSLQSYTSLATPRPFSMSGCLVLKHCEVSKSQTLGLKVLIGRTRVQDIEPKEAGV